MSTTYTKYPIHVVETDALIDELWQRDDLDMALDRFKARSSARAAVSPVHWWSRFRLGPHVWGLSSHWLCFCYWNGDTAWVTLPFIYFGAGTKNIELGLGKGKWHVTFDIRWRWD